MDRLKALLNPNAQGGIETAHYALLAIVLSLFMVARDFLPGIQSAFFVNGEPAPSISVLHLYNVRYVLHSQSWWDAASCECTPVDDVDYGFPNAFQEPARLPGGSWAHYRLLTYGNIPGSGYFLTVLAPNFGHLSFYHLAWYTTANGLDGGDIIGETNWPTSYVYSNGGTPGIYDAHYCIAYDAAGAWWLMGALEHPPPAPPKSKPHVFPRKRWGPISPYWRGHLSWSASVWLHHQRLGRALDRGHFYGRGRGGYTKVRFRYGAMFLWPHLHAVKVAFHR